MNENTPPLFPKDIPALTSLRFYAALFTAVYHIKFFSGLEFPVIISRIFAKGYLAVDFFFILSGFILAHTYLKSFQDKSFSYKNFLIRRIARIYPVHLFTLLAFLIIFILLQASGKELYENALSIWDFFSHLFMIHAWGTTDRLGYNQVSWSISAEWFAYLLFPVFLTIALDLKNSLLSLALAAGMFALLWMISQANLHMNVTQLAMFGIIRIIPEFFLGVSLYLFAKRYKSIFTGDFEILVLFIVLLFGFIFNLPDYFVLPVFSLIILIAAEQARAEKSGVLAGKWNVYLGQVSYSFYMVQYLVWYLVMFLGIRLFLGYNENNLTMYALWFLSLFLVQGAAILTYHLIEKPAQKWITKKWASRTNPKEKDTDNVMI